YKLAAVKMLGYFYAYSVLFCVFTIAWRKRWLDRTGLLTALLLAIGLAVFQTYFLGNAYGSAGNFFGSPDFEWRFTSFTGAQSFAAFLLAVIVLFLLCEEWTFAAVTGMLVAAVGILLTGSRSIFLGLAWILLTAGIVIARRKNHNLKMRTILVRLSVSVVV